MALVDRIAAGIQKDPCAMERILETLAQKFTSSSEDVPFSDCPNVGE